MNKTQVVILVATGALIGNYVTYRHMAAKYNVLVAKHNRLLEYDRIKQRVFKEVMPQLPTDYTLSRQTMTDIQVANMFVDNDM